MTFTTLKIALDSIWKIKDAFTSLKRSDLMAEEGSIAKIVEDYFAFELLPKGKINLEGKLSPFIPNSQYPIYTPRNFKEVSIKDNIIDPKVMGSQPHSQMSVKSEALNIPAITLNPIQLLDGTWAKVFWLYPQQTKGLNFPVVGKQLDVNKLNELFSINISDKPLLVLGDINIPSEQYFYKSCKITGTLMTARKEHFDVLASAMDPFMINYLSNCFRPFSNNDGVLAIDIRRPNGKIHLIDSKSSEFQICYTVQSAINFPFHVLENEKLPILVSKLIDFIPDRQGINAPIKTFADQTTNVGSIITMGDISWQIIERNHSFAAFSTFDASQPLEYQTNLTKLAYHWQIWKKASLYDLKKNVHADSQINTILCSNKTNELSFSENGLYIPKSLEMSLLNGDPNIRSSIDWLGISVGK